MTKDDKLVVDKHILYAYNLGMGTPTKVTGFIQNTKSILTKLKTKRYSIHWLNLVLLMLFSAFVSVLSLQNYYDAKIGVAKVEEILIDRANKVLLENAEKENVLGKKSGNSRKGRITYLSCTDTDGGKVDSVKGIVTVEFSYKGVGFTETFTDTCSSSSALDEYYCTRKSKGTVKSISCAYGCSDGACLPKSSEFPPPSTCIDNDNDGYGSSADSTCTYSTLDCNDNNNNINPGASEICGNGIDENCDGVDAVCGIGGVLQFKSGFENDVYIDNKDMAQNRFIKGVDLTQPASMGDWDTFSNLPWAEHTNGYFQGGNMEIISDPLDYSNKILHFFNNAKVLQSDYVSRSQWTLKQNKSWVDDGSPNLFDKQFYRYKILIPDDMTKVYSYGEWAGWYMIWESHAWDSEDMRHGIYIRKAKDSDLWYFRMVQQAVGSSGKPILWENSAQQDIAVPFGEWFTLDVYFKYHESDGEFYASIKTQNEPRKLLGHLKGKTKFGTKLRDQMVLKMYHDGDYIDKLKAIGLDGTHQYYDDFEIWSDYPPGYWN